MITLTSQQTQIRTILVSLLLGVLLAPWPKPSFSQTVASQEQAGSVLAIDKVTVQDGTIAGEIRNMSKSYRPRCAAIHPLYLVMEQRVPSRQRQSQ